MHCRHVVLNYLGFREIVAASPFLPAKLQGLSSRGRPAVLRKHICLGVVAEALPVTSLYAVYNAFREPLQNFKASPLFTGLFIKGRDVRKVIIKLFLKFFTTLEVFFFEVPLQPEMRDL